MNKQRRRTRNVIVLVVVGVVVGVAVGIIAIASRPEAVLGFRAVATVDAAGDAQVHETIRYHFPQKRHGIYRVLPDVPFTSAGQVRVTSDTYDAVSATPEGGGVRLRIGDPAHKISGDHRYDISYPLSTVDLGGGRFGWNGLGAGWDVPVEQTELDLVAPWRWVDATCDAGSTGAVGSCTVTQPVPGRLEVTHGRLGRNEGITVYATRGAPLAAAPTSRSIDLATPARSWSQKPVTLALVALVGVVLAGLVVAELLRRAGRDWVAAGPASTGSAADLAFATGTPGTATGAPAGATRVDDTRLAEWATTEFAPPRGLEPWQGGVLATETAKANDSVAWLLGLAVRGVVDIDESDPSALVVRRGSTPPDADVAALLDVAFAGRDAITLGKYDPSFTSMWRSLPAKAKQWYRASGFTDPVGERRATKAAVAGVVGIVLAAAALFASARASVDHAVAGVLGVGLFSLVAGAAFAAVSRAWELHVRTPAGSAMWLRVESFRRFLAASEAEHVRQAAERGVLREYTAWAVALDEVDHWTKATEAAGLEPSTPGLSTALAASAISSSMQSAGTPPSSSGGGGGGVGGGGGGGGGGSW